MNIGQQDKISEFAEQILPPGLSHDEFEGFVEDAIDQLRGALQECFRSEAPARLAHLETALEAALAAFVNDPNSHHQQAMHDRMTEYDEEYVESY